jgi:hypothetical protein
VRVRALLILLLLAPAAVADRAETTGVFRRASLALDRCTPREEILRARRDLSALPREPLSDDDWLDLHILLQAIDRRLHPAPRRPAGPPIRTEDYEFFTDEPVLDAVWLLEEAARLADLRPPPGARGDRKLQGAATALRRLAGAARWKEGADADPLLAAAGEVLADRALDLAFDLECSFRAPPPAGRALFLWRLENEHRIGLDPEEAARVGEQALAEVLRELEALAAEVGDGRTWRELVEASRADRPESPEALLAHCREVTERAMRAARESGLVPVPEFVLPPAVTLSPAGPAIPYACYHPGGRDRRGNYHGRVCFTDRPRGVPLEAWTRDRDRWWTSVIAVHEGVPGHHLQYAFASRARTPWRGHGHNRAYVEGWGLYSEDLMRRAGFFAGTEATLACLRMRLWRAVRVIVDVGLSTGRMRPSDAVRMLTGTVLMERTAAEMEVRRYLGSPTQPLSYLLGYRRIRAIRLAWLRRHGADREEEFHRRFLSLGCVPLDLAAAILLDRRKAYDWEAVQKEETSR